MNDFVQGETYSDRAGNLYTYVRRGLTASTVRVFEDTTGKLTCRHESGNFRWDDQQTELDILK
jgi:hypothetical protein